MSPDEPRRIPRFLACLIKGPAGCLAFVVGAAVVGVLLLPAAGGRVVDRMCEEWFEERFAGELELGDAWVGSLFGENRVRRVILRDPAGDEVLRGSVVGPTLAGVFEGASHRYGPLRIQLESLRLVTDEDGVTNLEQALAPKWESPGDSYGGRITTDEPFVVELELHVARLRYSSERGRETLLEDLYFQGRLEWGPRGARLVVDGRAPGEAEDGAPPPWSLRVECARVEDGLGRPWDIELAVAHVPTVLARALCPPLRPLVAWCGPLVDELAWSRRGSATSFACGDGGLRLALRGMELDGAIAGSAEAPLELAFACDAPDGRALLARVLPPFEAPACDDPSAVHVVRLHAFHWPLDGDWAELEGEVELALASGRATLLPLTPEGRPLALLLGPQAARLPLRAGVLDYAGLQLPLEDGWIRLDGTLELASGEWRVGVSGEQAGQLLERVEFASGDEDPSLPRIPSEPLPQAFDPPQVPEAPQR